MRATVSQRLPTPQEVADDAKVEAVAGAAPAAAVSAAAAAAVSAASSSAESLLEAEVAKAAAASASAVPPAPPSAASSSSPSLLGAAFYRKQYFNGSTYRTMPGGAVGEPETLPTIPTYPASQLSAPDLEAMPSIQPYYTYLALRAIGVRKALAAASAVANVGLGFDAAVEYVLSSEKIRVAANSRPVYLGQMATPYLVPQAGAEYPVIPPPGSSSGKKRLSRKLAMTEDSEIGNRLEVIRYKTADTEARAAAAAAAASGVGTTAAARAPPPPPPPPSFAHRAATDLTHLGFSAPPTADSAAPARTAPVPVPASSAAATTTKATTTTSSTSSSTSSSVISALHRRLFNFGTNTRYKKKENGFDEAEETDREKENAHLFLAFISQQKLPQ